MRRLCTLSTALATTIALAAAVVSPTFAGALPLTPPSPAAIRYQPNQGGHASAQRREHVAASGIYRIKVSVTARRGSDRLVRLRIGRLTRRVWAAGAARSATIVVVESLAHRWLLVRATTRREAPLLAVAVSRVSPLTPVTAPAPAKPTTRATGPTGPTGVLAPVTPAAPVAPAPAPVPPAPLPPRDLSLGPWGPTSGSWRLAFDDEFNGTSLDSSLWNTGVMGSGLTGPMNSDELECYSPAQDVVSGGELDLNAAAVPQTGCPMYGGPQTVNEPYVSGLINTQGKFSYTYGFLEARVWLPGSPWAGVDWPAVWEVGSPAPQNGEIDDVEGLLGRACFHFHDGAGNPYGDCLGGFNGAWHTYGVDWEPGLVTWYYDGNAVGTASTNITSAPMYLIADLALDNGTQGGPIQAPASLRIDYIRVWQH
jgi:hypothetical protein